MNIFQVSKSFELTDLEDACQQPWIIIRPWEHIRCSPSRCWKLGATGKHVGHSETHAGIQLSSLNDLKAKLWWRTVLQLGIG